MSAAGRASDELSLANSSHRVERTMFIAHRTKRRIRAAAVACIAIGVLAAMAAAVLPRDAKTFAASFGWWVWAIPVGLVAYAALEFIGTWSLGQSFWQRMPGWARVCLLVMVISLVAAGAVLVSQPFSSTIAR